MGRQALRNVVECTLSLLMSLWHGKASFAWLTFASFKFTQKKNSCDYEHSKFKQARFGRNNKSLVWSCLMFHQIFTIFSPFIPQLLTVPWNKLCSVVESETWSASIWLHWTTADKPFVHIRIVDSHWTKVHWQYLGQENRMPAMAFYFSY